MVDSRAEHIVFLVHYFPPINSSGAKRIESLTKYFVRAGRRVSVITTIKRAPTAAFSEQLPLGVEVLVIDWLGRLGKHKVSAGDDSTINTSGSGGTGLGRKLKDIVMRWFGQLPDPRLPFSLAFASPLLAKEVRQVLRSADIVIGSSPPWPMLLAALFVRERFGPQTVMDYRDQFSQCYSMPGSNLAKVVETLLDGALARRADIVVTVSDPMATYYRPWNPSVHTVMNGFDPEVLDRIRGEFCWQPREVGTPLKIRYLGMMSKHSVPKNLLTALMLLQKQGSLRESDVQFEFFGECSVLRSTLENEFSTLSPFFCFKPTVPHIKALEHMVTSDFLLFAETSQKSMLSAQGVLTTKLFEYLGSGRPIIADIDPATLAGQLIRQCGPSHFVTGSADDFFTYLSSPAFFEPTAIADHPHVKSLSRKTQAEQYLYLLDNTCASVSA